MPRGVEESIPLVQLLQCINQGLHNRANNGSGLYLEVNANLYILKSYSNEENLLIFKEYQATYKGAIYVADNTNSGACSPENKCFIQTIALYQKDSSPLNTKNVYFSGNTAISEPGTNLFGGLLDRCIPSPFTETSQTSTPPYHIDVVLVTLLTSAIYMH